MNKNIFTILFLLFPLCGRVFSLDDPQLNFIIEGGIKQGTTNEMVYNENKQISRLDWADDIIPVASGFMEDYDYLLQDSNIASHYSWHDAYLDKDFILSGEVGYKFRFGDSFISPSAGFAYQNKKWTAQDEYLQYPLKGPWTGEESKQKISGFVISYEQALWYPYGAIELGYIYHYGRHGKFLFTINGSIYPFVSAQTNDTHFLRSVYFYDSLSGGYGWNSGIRIGYFPEDAKGLGIIISSGLEKLINLKGNTSSNNGLGRTILDQRSTSADNLAGRGLPQEVRKVRVVADLRSDTVFLISRQHHKTLKVFRLFGYEIIVY